MQQAILDAQAQLERALKGRPLVELERTVVIDGVGGYELQLPWSVSNQTGFEISLRDAPSGSWLVLADTSYELGGRDLEPDVVTRRDGRLWPHGQGLVQVTLTGGWMPQTVPFDLKGQLLMGAARLVRSRPQLRGSRGESEESSGVVPFDEAVIAPYRAEWREVAELLVR